MTSRIISVVLIFFAVAEVKAENVFDYSSGPNGPESWSTNFPTCGGDSQSPINIEKSAVKIDDKLGLFSHTMFGSKFTGITLKNDGHQLVAEVTDGYTIKNSSLLEGEFKLNQFHFHWAKSSSEGGSEHLIDDKHYYGEMHLVHYNTKYAGFDAAKTKTDGLAVIAFFMETTYPQDNLDFNRILGKVTDGNVSYAGDQYVYKDEELFSMETLLPHDISMYYRYRGSLTTPTCDESVIWTVFRDPVLISEAQGEILSKSLYTVSENGTSEDDLLRANYRPVQDVNGRVVYQPPPLMQGNTAAKNNIVNYILTGTCIVLAKFTNLP